uniref:Methyltransferase FkbM domain-containing protein n=1 Tax=Aquisalinus luteolus TaxID=1566827 RepID=A0A8J3A5K6_9PROT|nr:hypothetical protein GCM10011355_07490 [Aquisalinus luteolus]
MQVVDARVSLDLASGLHDKAYRQLTLFFAADLARTPYCLLMQAKDHILRPTRVEDLFSEDGRPFFSLASEAERPVNDMLRGAYNFYNVSTLRIPKSTPPSTTPMMIIRAEVDALKKSIELRAKSSPRDFMASNADSLTFLALYQAYLFSRENQPTSLYVSVQQNRLKLTSDWPNNWQDIDEILDRTRKNDCRYFSIHAARLGKLAREHTDKLLLLWRNCGLIADNENTDWLVPVESSGEVHNPFPDIPDEQFRLYYRQGLTLLLDKNCLVDQYMIERGYWENRQIERLLGFAEAAELKPGAKRVFLDVGSFWALYSLKARQSGLFDEIVLFEADHRNFSQLQAQLFLNHVIVPDEIRTIFAPVTDKPGPVNMMRSELRRDGNRGAAGIMPEGHPVPPIELQGVSLDSVLDYENCLLVMKFDVEKHEIQVLAGARTLLRANEAVLQIESYELADDVHSFLKGIGYRKLGEIGPDRFYSNIPSLESFE